MPPEASSRRLKNIIKLGPYTCDSYHGVTTIGKRQLVVETSMQLPRNVHNICDSLQVVTTHGKRQLL